MLRHVLMAAPAALMATALPAAPLAVRVLDVSGKPVADAVVAFYPTGAAARPARPGRFTIAQKNLKFQPFLSIIPVGSDVSFPNLDPTKHHVYSFSPAKRFELKLFAKDQSRTVHFDKPGAVALGCNIHDSMSAFIFVADSALTVRTDRRGIASFGEVPAAGGTLKLWHPYARAPGGMVQLKVAPGQRVAAASLKLRPPPPMLMKDY